MALIDLWNSAREAIKDKHIQQVMSFAGNGRLTDGSETSAEFRAYLSYVPSELLARYATECLTTSFDQGGFALQDIVNQIGRRLSFDVSDGSYRGKKGAIGFDGIWKSSLGDDIVVEVKTTDAYRIDLDTLATYRNSLVKEGRISERDSSILIVVGRQDTGDLEAQIRGSRHAWDIRLISVESLIRLLRLKETLDDPNIVQKICTILTPQEYTRVDGIIDLVFWAAEDISAGSASAVAENGRAVAAQLQLEEPGPLAVVEHLNGPEPQEDEGDKQQRVNFHEQCVARLSQHLKTALVKQSRTSYKAPDGHLALSLAVSREYVRNGRSYYWFAFHSYHHEQLQVASQGYAAFGCGSEQVIFLFPLDKIAAWLPMLNQTVNESRYYWHIHIRHSEGGRWLLAAKGKRPDVDITGYLLK